MASSAFVSQKEFNQFHLIDRQLYSVLVMFLWQDPTEALQLMAFWIWLERMGCTNLVHKILSLPSPLIGEIAKEAFLVLNCIKHDQFTFSPEDTEMPLTKRLTVRDLSLKPFHEDRVIVSEVVAKVQNGVCLRALTDIMQAAIKRNATQSLIGTQAMAGDNQTQYIPEMAPQTKKSLKFGSHGLIPQPAYGDNTFEHPNAGYSNDMLGSEEIVPSQAMAGDNQTQYIPGMAPQTKKSLKFGSHGLIPQPAYGDNTFEHPNAGYRNDMLGSEEIVPSQAMAGDNQTQYIPEMAPQTKKSLKFGSHGLIPQPAYGDNTFEHPNAGYSNDMLGSEEIVPSHEPPTKKQVPVGDDKTMFATFSKGHHVWEWELRQFLDSNFGDCIESLKMQVVTPNEQALFATIVFRSPETMQLILRGMAKAKFTINDKHVWVRKYIPKPPRYSPQASSEGP